MSDEPVPAGERRREQEAASCGIEMRPAVLEIDDDDDALEVGEPGDAEDGDDHAVEDGDAARVDADV